MSSSDYLAKAKQYKELSDILEGLYSPIEACVASITANEPAMEENIISEQPLDDGQLTEAKKEISAISDDISTMQAECGEKYAYWYDLYEKAKEEELKVKKKWWQ